MNLEKINSTGAKIHAFAKVHEKFSFFPQLGLFLPPWKYGNRMIFENNKIKYCTDQEVLTTYKTNYKYICKYKFIF